MSGRKRAFRCFACREDVPRSQVKKSGPSKNGGRWYLCKECSASYKAAKALDQAAYDAATSDRVLTDSGKIQMGWNGVPSERSLKRRSR